MNAIHKQGNEIDRPLWLDFLLHSPQAALYVHPDYMDVVSPGWSAIELWRDKSLLAIMPICQKQKSGYAYALQPAYCQYWGILFAGGDFGNAYKTYSHRRKVVKAMVDAIPTEIKWFLYGFAPEFDYPLPFHWAGYSLQTRYTYRLDLQAGFAAVEKGFGNDTRYEIRKARTAGMRVRTVDACEGLLKLVKENAALGKKMLRPAESATLEKLTAFFMRSGLGKLYEVVAADDVVVGGALVGSFAGKTFYQMSAQLPSASGSGAMSLLLAHMIEDAATTDHIFDFEGSMIEGIESFFRGFGGRPVPYLMIEKNALPLPIRWIRKLR